MVSSQHCSEFQVYSFRNDARAVLQPNRRTVLYRGKLGAGASHPGMRVAGVLDSAKPAGMESEVRYADKPGTVLSIWGTAHGVSYLYQVTPEANPEVK